MTILHRAFEVHQPFDIIRCHIGSHDVCVLAIAGMSKEQHVIQRPLLELTIFGGSGVRNGPKL